MPDERTVGKVDRYKCPDKILRWFHLKVLVDPTTDPLHLRVDRIRFVIGIFHFSAFSSIPEEVSKNLVVSLETAVPSSLPRVVPSRLLIPWRVSPSSLAALRPIFFDALPLDLTANDFDPGRFATYH